ncbi:MAG: SUMF1/EgtB/PvdO family nonheme iron enzyme, partial [Myxococcales bacterium]|nr:SUMF1/EgtB/PvdO family nonheme iron enzyme [Myxococcales bacterium]
MSLACPGSETLLDSGVLVDSLDSGSTEVNDDPVTFIPDLTAEVADGSLVLRWSPPAKIAVDYWLLYYRPFLPGPPWDGNNASNGVSPLVVAKKLLTYTLAGLPNDQTVYVWLVGFVSEQAVAQSHVTKATPRRDGAAQVLIPAGVFWMGNDDIGSAADESPRHPVYLDAFWIDRYVATNAEYRDCVGSGHCPQPASTSGFVGNLVSVPDYFNNPLYDSWPVVFLSYDAALSYCAAQGKRLPTEAEWERVARGTSVGKYPWGDAVPDCTKANFADEGSFCLGGPSPVGLYSAPNVAFGVTDIVGNVWQWTHDWYSPVTYLSGYCNNPTGPAVGTERVLRGGAWYYDTDALLVTHRNHWAPALDTASAEFGGYFGFGVRCAHTAQGVPCDQSTQLCELPFECEAPISGEDVSTTPDTTVDTVDIHSDIAADLQDSYEAADSNMTETTTVNETVGDDVGTEPVFCNWVQDEPQDLAACASTPAPNCPSGWPDACPQKPCSCAVSIQTDAPACAQEEFTVVAGWRDLEKNFHVFEPSEAVEICEGFQGGIHITAALTLFAPNETADFLYADMYVLS